MGQAPKRTKKQHYVPQFYLQNFTSDGSKLFVYDKVRKMAFESNIGDVGQERYFYEIPTVEDGEQKEELKEAGLDEKTAIEEVMRIYDDACARALASVLQGIRSSCYISKDGDYLFAPSSDQKMGLSFFAALQEMRTKEAREKMAQMSHLMFKSVAEMTAKEKFPDIDPSQFKIRTNSEYDSVFQSKLLLDQENLEGIARVCTFGRIWVLGINRTSTPLLISDHPIIKRSHDPHPFYRSSGWLSPYLEVGIPITRDMIVMLFCPMIYRERCRFGEQWKLNNTVRNLTPENVLYYNSLQCSNSHRFLYSSNDDWTMVERYLKDFPHHGDPGRQKVSLQGFGKDWKLHPDWRL